MTTAKPKPKPRQHPPSSLADGDPRPRLFTNAEYHAMADAGIFAPDERVQLLAGEIVVMSPMGSRHAAGICLLTDEFATSGRLAGRALVRVQLPVVIPDISEPRAGLGSSGPP